MENLIKREIVRFSKLRKDEDIFNDYILESSDALCRVRITMTWWPMLQLSRKSMFQSCSQVTPT